jgi:hypothetical protein
LLRFGCFAGNGVVAAGKKSEDGRKPFQIFPFAGLFSGGAWEDAPPLFLLFLWLHRTGPGTVMDF